MSSERNSELASRGQEVSSLQSEVVRLGEQLLATRQRQEEREADSTRDHDQEPGAAGEPEVRVQPEGGRGLRRGVAVSLPSFRR